LENILEIAVFSAEGAIIAAQAGVSRIELCNSYAEGGLTPSTGTITFVKETVHCPVYVMIRPRGGNFFYNHSEIEIMKRDIEQCREKGVDGIVAGALKNDFSIDEKTISELVKLAAPLPFTFHRAFDVCYDPETALKILIDCGVKRILTSGQKSSALEGAVFISELNKKSNGRIVLMPGAGINPGNISEIVRQTGCHEFHASAKRISSASDVFGFGENVLPHPEIIAELKNKLALC
jgi:copper homeostasis protein